MPATMERFISETPEHQPSLFSADWASRAERFPTRATVHIPAQAAERAYPARTGRLFSLGQRGLLMGEHPRRRGPAAGRAYVAGVALPPGSSVSRLSQVWDRVTVTIGELDLRDPQPVLHVVEHYRWPLGAVDAGFQGIERQLDADWNCRRIVVGEPSTTGRSKTRGAVEILTLAPESKSSLAASLLQAASAARIKMYASDGSQEQQEFWAQAVKAQARYGPDGSLDFFVEHSTGGDGFLLSLALVAEAARALLSPKARAA